MYTPFKSIPSTALIICKTSLDVAFCPVTTTAATSATACGTAVAAAVKDVDDAAFAKTQLLCTHLASGGCELAKAACQWKKSSWYGSSCSACSGACPARLTAGDDDDGNTTSALVDTATTATAAITNNQTTSDAEIARTVFGGIIALTFLYIVYVVGTQKAAAQPAVASFEEFSEI